MSMKTFPLICIAKLIGFFSQPMKYRTRNGSSTIYKGRFPQLSNIFITRSVLDRLNYESTANASIKGVMSDVLLFSHPSIHESKHDTFYIVQITIFQKLSYSYCFVNPYLWCVLCNLQWKSVRWFLRTHLLCPSYHLHQ